jgi:uncharacterized phage-like protein YoqJ
VGVPKADRGELRKVWKKINTLFCGERWAAEEVEALKEKYPITHLVIHKNYPHPKAVPLENVYENEDYIVYAF